MLSYAFLVYKLYK